MESLFEFMRSQENEDKKYTDEDKFEIRKSFHENYGRVNPVWISEESF